MAKSKFFRAFVEGDTISDGRKVTAAMIDQVVETFNFDTYGPRINVEHFKGFSPEPPFNGYGDVIAVRAQTDAIQIAGTAEQRRALYCQVDGNAQLEKLAKAGQKPYPSVELTPSYAGTDKVGLIGLAFTDSPASIATQKLQFSRSAPGTLRAHGDAEVALEFEASPADAADPAKVEGTIAGFFSALTAKLRGTDIQSPPTPPAPPPVPANDNGFAAFATELAGTVAQAIAAGVKPVADAQTAIDARFTALETRLAQTPAAQQQYQRTLATGGSGAVLTDC